MRRTYLTFEVLLLLFTYEVEILSFYYTIPLIADLLVGLLVVFLQYWYEGFRLCSLSYFIILPCAIYPSHITRIIALILMSFIVWYFPLHRIEDPAGPFLPGYKTILLNGNLDVGVFYPTLTKGKPSPFIFSDKYVPYKVVMAITKLMAGDGMPAPMAWFLTHHLTRREIDVNTNEPIVSKHEYNRPDGKYPVIVFSHGLAASRNDYTTQLRSWASKGFIVVTVQHFNDDLRKADGLVEQKDRMKKSLETRMEEIGALIDFVNDKQAIQNFFNDESVTIDTNNISVSGHSFGGLTAGCMAAKDPRITGGVILLDPYLAELPQEFYTDIKKPLIIIETELFTAARPELPAGVRNYAKANVSCADQTMICFFKGSAHNDFADHYAFLCRESIMGKTIAHLEGLEDHVMNNLALTNTFLDVFLAKRSGEPRPDKRAFVEAYQRNGSSFLLELQLRE